VKLFFDEDQGKGISEALHAVGITSDYVGPGRRIKKGTPDEEWIPLIGQRGDLVITGNKEILRTEAQRGLWIQNGVGGVFLTTNHMTALNELRLLLRKLAWLERIDREERRPFAFMLTPTGKTRQAPEVPLL
jgi:hypothetical protein